MLVFFPKKNFEVLRLLHLAQELKDESRRVSAPTNGANGRDFLGLFGHRDLRDVRVWGFPFRPCRHSNRERIKSSRERTVVKAQILSHESHKVTDVNEDAVVW